MSCPWATGAAATVVVKPEVADFALRGSELRAAQPVQPPIARELNFFLVWFLDRVGILGDGQGHWGGLGHSL